MLGWRLIKIFTVVVIILVIATPLAFIIWQHDHSCGQIMSDSCLKIYRPENRFLEIYIILLELLSQYQTLIGGLAALGAGVFALKAAKFTAQAAKDTEQHRRRVFAKTTCFIASDDFYMAAQSLSSIYQGEVIVDNKAGIYEHQPANYRVTLHEISTSLGSIINSVHAKANAQVRNPTEKIRQVAAECYICATILAYVADNLSVAAEFDLDVNANIPAGVLNGQLASLNIDYHEVGFLAHFIDWKR